MIALALAAILGLAAQVADPDLLSPYPYGAIDWTSVGQPHLTPRNAFEASCPYKDPRPEQEACRRENWARVLAEYHQGPLTAPEGGRSYRLTTMFGGYSDAPSLYRLDVDAKGKANLTAVSLQTVRAGQPEPRFLALWGSVTPAQLAAFDAALQGSDFYTMPKPLPTGMVHLCHDGVNATFEGVERDRYKWVVEGCGGEARLLTAIKTLKSIPLWPTRLFTGVDYEYQAYGWVPADAPRAPVRTVTVDVACGRFTILAWDDCGRQAWSDVLQSYRETPLTSPAGGHSYRFFISGSIYSSAPSMYRLDVMPSGAGRLRMVSLESFRDKKDKERYAEQVVPMTADEVKTFETAVEASPFVADPPKRTMFCTDGSDIGLEAIKDGQYRWMTDSCGQAKLWAPLKVLEGVKQAAW